MKKRDFLWFLNRNIVTGITDNTFSGQGMLFGTFLMKNIFVDFPTPIFNRIFCSISLKNSMTFIGIIGTTMLHPHTITKFGLKKHGFFSEIEQKYGSK